MTVAPFLIKAVTSTLKAGRKLSPAEFLKAVKQRVDELYAKKQAAVKLF